MQDASIRHTEAPALEMPVWGKSSALAWFGPRLRRTHVPASLVIARREGPGVAMLRAAEFARLHPQAQFAVRSDAADEDRRDASLAGHYVSRLDVSAPCLAEAIACVFASMPDAAEDAVLLQPMVRARRFGVASTHRIKDGAPWYCVEFAAAAPAAVTAGQADGRLMAVARQRVSNATLARLSLPEPLPVVLAALLEIEALAAGTPLEIEFALVDAEPDAAIGATMLVLLQVRRLSTAHRWATSVPDCEPPRLAWLRDADPQSGIVGRRSLLSLMSDWNPAELLGTHPRPLARSLFDRLIGRGVWWNARDRLGYAAPPHPDVELLHPVQGRPYVDVRRSANSLLPRGLDPQTRADIVDVWLDRLECNPGLHDKVEFTVFRTARDFASPDELRRRWSPLLGSRRLHDWETRLGALTADLLRQAGDAQLRRQLAASAASGDTEADWPVLLERSRAGAAEFAALARIAFVAEAQLRSAVEREALSPERANALRRASASVCRLLGAGEEGRDLDDSMIVHLRPGTFDITRPPHPLTPAAAHERARPDRFELQAREARALQALLHEAGFALDPAAWVAFVMQACRAREWAKFVFTRPLCIALERIAEAFADAGLGRDLASWLDIDTIEAGMRRPPLQLWQQQAAAAAQHHAHEHRYLLSPLLGGPRDAWFADSLGVLPNFVGEQVVSAPLAMPEGDALPQRDLRGAIVLLHHADPGYDWLFGHDIAGLITAWGGAHSHMAIRCAEFGLAAAIGCGEAVFRRAQRAQRARLDPLQGSLWLD